MRGFCCSWWILNIALTVFIVYYSIAFYYFQLPILENNRTTASRLNLLQSSKSAITPSSPMGDAFPVINNNSRSLTNGANNNRDENHSGNLPLTPTGKFTLDNRLICRWHSIYLHSFFFLQRPYIYMGTD